MATQKITVTLDDDQVKEIRALVAAGQAANVSAFVQHVWLCTMRQDGKRCWGKHCNKRVAP
jgi:hypothetical protein